MPYLRSEYGKEFDFDAPVKLLDAMMHEQAQEPGQQVCWAPLRCPYCPIPWYIPWPCALKWTRSIRGFFAFKYGGSLLKVPNVIARVCFGPVLCKQGGRRGAGGA